MWRLLDAQIIKIMKNYIKKAAILLALLFSYSFFACEGSQSGNKPTDINIEEIDFSAAVTNVEDLIDSTADFNVTHTQNNTSYRGDYVAWNGTSERLGKRFVYTANLNTEATGNIIDYDGNLGIWNDWDKTFTSYQNSQENKTWYTGTGFQLINGTDYAETAGDGYGLLRFRTKYDVKNSSLSLGMMTRGVATIPNDTLGGYGCMAYKDAKFGYFFSLNRGGTIDAYEWRKGNSGPTLLTTPTCTSTISKGDILDIIFGVYKYSKTVNVLRLDIKKWNATEKAWTVVCDYTYVDTDVSDTAFDAKNRYFSIQPLALAEGKRPSYEGVLLAGIEEPILTDVAAQAKSLNGYTATLADDTLSSITLPAGYAWKNAATVLEAGERQYDATYTYEYYGVSKSIDVKVGVTVS